MTLENVEQRLRNLEDIEAIRTLKARYCAYCDNSYDPDGIAGLFVDEGVWDGGDRMGEYNGKEAIRDFFAEASKMFPFALHYGLNHTIDVDGDSARGTWFLFMAATRRDEHGERAIWNALRYEDDLVRVDGQWKFKRIRVAERYFTTPFDVGWAKQASL